MSIQIVILAAGQGKRMHSHWPKVLHPLAGKPLLEHVILTALNVANSQPPIIVHGHQGELLKQNLGHYSVKWVEQKQQLGTGHALQQALPELDSHEHVLVLYGDVPLISEMTLKTLIDSTPKNAIGMLTAELANPKGYGRIKRDRKGKITKIIEEKEANTTELNINEINPGIYLVPVKYVKKWLPLLKNNNEQHEYYLTDMIAFAVKEKLPIHAIQPLILEEILGVNDKTQLAVLERFYQLQLAEKLMRGGVTLIDPHRIDIRGDVNIGRDVIIDVNVILSNVHIGNACRIGANVILSNAKLADNVEVKPNSIIEDAEVGENSVIGPFARLRPGTQLAADVHIGNFVEIKKAHIDAHSKVNHLTYIGDAEIGARVNIGAGTITCNYDGANKHKTIIGNDVLVGSDTLFVAPVSVGEGATLGAGSIVVKDVPGQALTITQKLEQRSNRNWQRPKKKQG
jgi:bifunctional UDP-N-acetylglucosamine pyrophosphorylase / glucosamine-1-phosphate N-acetyltransferase